MAWIKKAKLNDMKVLVEDYKKIVEAYKGVTGETDYNGIDSIVAMIEENPALKKTQKTLEVIETTFNQKTGETLPSDLDEKVNAYVPLLVSGNTETQIQDRIKELKNKSEYYGNLKVDLNNPFQLVDNIEKIQTSTKEIIDIYEVIRPHLKISEESNIFIQNIGSFFYNHITNIEKGIESLRRYASTQSELYLEALAKFYNFFDDLKGHEKLSSTNTFQNGLVEVTKAINGYITAKQDKVSRTIENYIETLGDDGRRLSQRVSYEIKEELEILRVNQEEISKLLPKYDISSMKEGLKDLNNKVTPYLHQKEAENAGPNKA